MTERDWQKDWETCERATSGKWEMVSANCPEGPYMIRMPYPKGGTWYGVRMIAWKEDAEFIAEAREALPYWLNQMLDVVMSLCHEGVMTMSRAREILGVTLHEADKLYAEWLKTYGTAGGKQILKQDTVTGRTVRVDMSYSDIIDK